MLYHIMLSENHLNFKFKVVQTNNGGELHRVFAQYLTIADIHHLHTCPHTSQQMALLSVSTDT